jgi:hypothetical protein
MSDQVLWTTSPAGWTSCGCGGTSNLTWVKQDGAARSLIEPVSLRLQVRPLKEDLLGSWIHRQCCERVTLYLGSAKGDDTRTEREYRRVEWIHLIGMNITLIGELYRFIQNKTMDHRICSDLLIVIW